MIRASRGVFAASLIAALVLAPAASASAVAAPTAAAVVRPSAASLVAPVPRISGTAAAGSTLTAAAGTWTAGTTLTYQWRADGKAIAGATARTYRLPSTLVHKRITVTVTGRKSGFTAASRTSAATARVALAPAPKVSGTPVVGAKLTAVVGTWTSGTRLTYQWLAEGKPVAGATGSTFAIPASLKDKRFAVKVTGVKAGYASVAKTSATTAYAAVASTPVVSGSAKVGATLIATPGTWTTGAKLSYQWYAGTAAVKGATARTFVVPASSVGKTVTVKVTAVRSGYPTVSRASAATATITYPTRVPSPPDSWNCPSWAPIKGNASSKIYHVPGGRYYDKTNPEECFASEAAARAAGYRASKL